MDSFNTNAGSTVSTGPNYAAIIAATVAVGGALSNAFNEPALGAVISDPHTAQLATSAVSAIAALITAFQGPVHSMVTRVVSVVKH